MRSKFPSFVAILALLAALAMIAHAQPAGVSAPPVAGAAAAKKTPEELMESATAAFQLHRSFSARLRHNVHLFGQTLVGKGTYQQLGEGLNKLLRVEMTVKASGQGAASQLAHVCDGRYLWTFEEVGGKSKLGRVDLRRVNLAIESAKEESNKPIPSLPTLSLGSGGLGRLLGDLHEQFEFHTAQPDTLSGDPVWVMDGRWRKDRLAELLPKQAEKIRAGKSPNLEKLAPHLPHEVRLLISRDDALLPYRVEFAATRYDEASDTTERTTIVAMDIYEIKVNEPLDPQLFVYKPGSVEIADRTENFLIQHGLLKKKQQKEEK